MGSSSPLHVTAVQTEVHVAEHFTMTQHLRDRYGFPYMREIISDSDDYDRMCKNICDMTECAFSSKGLILNIQVTCHEFVFHI